MNYMYNITNLYIPSVKGSPHVQFVSIHPKARLVSELLVEVSSSCELVKGWKRNSVLRATENSESSRLNCLPTFRTFRMRCAGNITWKIRCGSIIIAKYDLSLSPAKNTTLTIEMTVRLAKYKVPSRKTMCTSRPDPRLHCNTALHAVNTSKLRSKTIKMV